MKNPFRYDRSNLIPLYLCSDGHFRREDEIVNAAAGVAMDSAIEPTVATRSQHSIAGKSKAETKKLLTAIGMQEWMKQARPDEIGKFVDDMQESFSQPAKPAAKDAAPLTADEQEMIATVMAERKVRPARRASVAKDSPQFVDGYGNNVDHEFLTFDSKPIVTKPPVYKPVKALPKVRR